MKYAQYDHTATSPQPVIGWYNTDDFEYPNMPPTEDLLGLTQAQWERRFDTPFVCNGELVVAPAPVPPTAAELFSQSKTQYQDAVQTYIISTAQKKGYRDDVSCASYFSDPHQPFAADAQAFVPWRSSVWLQCYADLTAIQAGTMPMPVSPTAYILTLPAVPAGF